MLLPLAQRPCQSLTSMPLICIAPLTNQAPTMPSAPESDNRSPNVNPSRTACRQQNGHYDHSKHRCYKFNAPDTRAGIRCNQCSNMGVRGQAELRAGWNCLRCGYWLCQDCFTKYERTCPSINAHAYDDNGARRTTPMSAPRR
jgi:hypothetical protein